MPKNSFDSKVIERRFFISNILLDKGYFNEAVIFSWIAIRETIFFLLEHFEIPYRSTTEAIFRFIEHQNYSVHSKDIILFYHIGIMAEWDRNFKIENEDAFKICTRAKQIYEEMINLAY